MFWRPGKDRLNVLAALQNVESLTYRFNRKTLETLDKDFDISDKWRAKLQSLIEDKGGNVELDELELNKLRDQWMSTPCTADRLAIHHAGAIVYYREQTMVPVVEILVCDDAPQFKLLTVRCITMFPNWERE